MKVKKSIGVPDEANMSGHKATGVVREDESGPYSRMGQLYPLHQLELGGNFHVGFSSLLTLKTDLKC